MADSLIPRNARRQRIDKGTVAGVLCALGAIIGGLVLERGSVSDIAQLTAAIIVFGGTFGAVLISTPFDKVIAAVRALRIVLFESQSELPDTLEQVIEFATQARRRGILALEEDATHISDPSFRRAMDLAIDGVPSTDIREMMEIEILSEEARTNALAKVYETAGGYAPTIGIIGAVLGLIQVMKNLANIDEVGHGIAVAFVATIYGVGSANLLFLPAAAKIRAHASRRSESTALITEGVVGIAEGMNPRLLRRRLEPIARVNETVDATLNVATGATSETLLS